MDCLLIIWVITRLGNVDLVCLIDTEGTCGSIFMIYFEFKTHLSPINLNFVDLIEEQVLSKVRIPRIVFKLVRRI